MGKAIKYGLHRVEPLTSGQPYTVHTLEQHHHYRYGESNPVLLAKLRDSLPSPEDEDRELNQQRRQSGLR